MVVIVWFLNLGGENNTSSLDVGEYCDSYLWMETPILRYDSLFTNSVR